MVNQAVDAFSRYLSAKTTVDDRSLNLWVYRRLQESLAAGPPDRRWRLVEVGCGLGTMIERLWDWGLVARAAYTAVDRDPALIAAARERLATFAVARGLTLTPAAEAVRLAGDGRDWLISWRTEDFLAFCRSQDGEPGWDLVLAHAFLDLVDLDVGLPWLLSLLRPGGWYYFTLNFDGGTIWHPPVDPAFEDLVVRYYHQSMDQRQAGRAGHSQTGRRLLEALGRLGSEILAAGSSDWLVWPTRDGSYPAQEAYFLEYLLQTLHQAVASHPDVDQPRLQSWLARRRAQLAGGKLIFMAHQLDVCGRLSPGPPLSDY